MKAEEQYKVEGAWVEGSSGCHRYSYWNEQFLFDGRDTTGWCTPSRTVWQNEFLDIALPHEHNIGKMRILSRRINENAGFPTALRLLKRENGEAQAVLDVRGVKNKLNFWHEWEWTPTIVQNLRLEFLDVNWRPNGKYFLQMMCLEFYASSSTATARA